ncbi:MAG: ABC transporter ATP-binding protein [Chloroflexi bacterium]|nr:ABC transporter ATP-binding protein [Chloroflexota bacterium]
MAVRNGLLQVIDLKTYFFTRWGVVKAVDGVSFSLEAGKTLGLVGESGCGKSITCLSILRLVPEPAGRIVGGKILFEGDDLLAKSQGEMRKFRGKRVSMILQDPMTSLDPVFTIGSQLSEAIETHQRVNSGGLRQRVREMLRLVEIPSPEVRMRSYPHEMSGGMRQRVVGAIALSCEPHLLIADEPTTSLDVTTQAQYLRLLKGIQERSRVGMIFITHDLGIAAKMCDRVAVMYAGKIVEEAGVRRIFGEPAHPYTVALMKSLPKLECKTDRLFSIEGQPPALHNLPPGCSFAPRCPDVMDICQSRYPPVASVGEDHHVACWLRT